jgi:hypothetical protein
LQREAGVGVGGEEGREGGEREGEREGEAVETGEVVVEEEEEEEEEEEKDAMPSSPCVDSNGSRVDIKFE